MLFAFRNLIIRLRQLNYSSIKVKMKLIEIIHKILSIYIIEKLDPSKLKNFIN